MALPPITKILMYSHDTFGLGHIRRTLAIARSLRKAPGTVLILTGSPLVGRFNIPRRVDFVRIPGMIKVTNEQYLPLSMKLEATQVLEIRKSIILSTAQAFGPDFFVVDKAPLGLKREVVDTLLWIKESHPQCRSILGLRDIMDSASSTIEDWESKGIYEAMESLYDEIWVYGHRDFYDPVKEYGIPDTVARKVTFTGYIPRHVPTEADVAAVRKELDLAGHHKMVLMTTGGGGDGYPVVNTFLKAFETHTVPDGMRAVIVTGPFLSAGLYKDVKRRCEAIGFTVLRFHRFMEGLIGAADVVVSMGGYNTVCEIISQRKPFLIIPRTVPREEQLIRAQVLCSKGYCEYLHPDQLTPEAVFQKVVHLLNNGREMSRRAEHFPFTALDVIRQRVLQNRKEAVR
ncbi:Predicted glycosyl transferase [Desulfacinum infernum DSM 9756]|uniref:Predicted glycosyl transferase n=1 Tax=Desulfacinum infernum DSM 9756 TaxID=1121391 RepID=A0A1M4YBI0_9BACT|nr:glycosyltransferase [Desulfacinum infernum]SHF03097.1 Predicted glycosyl transferase [Desulfacinum infernum DSM 9756]